MDELWEEIRELSMAVVNGTIPDEEKPVVKKNKCLEEPLHEIVFTGEDTHDYPLVCRLIEESAHFPSPSLTNLVKEKCSMELARGDLPAAAVSLLYSQGVMFMHKALHTLIKNKMRREDAGVKKQGMASLRASQRDLFAEDDEDDLEEDELERTEDLRRKILALQTKSMTQQESLEHYVSELPPNWKVVQLSVEPTTSVRFKKEPKAQASDQNFSMLMTSFLCRDMAGTLDVTRVEPLDSGGCPSLLKELRDVVKLHKEIYKDKSDKQKYGKARKEMQDRSKGFLNSVENHWLAEVKVLLLGRPKDEKRVEAINTAVNAALSKAKMKVKDSLKNGFLFSLFDGASTLSQEQIDQATARVTNVKTKIRALSAEVAAFKRNNPEGETVERHPISLILDPDVQEVPWESLPVLNGLPVARSPSIFFLCALYQTHMESSESVAKTGVRNDHVYYVLNPNQDLPKTEERLSKPFQTELSLGPGKVGAWPTGEEFQKALSQKDAFMYCGHGSMMKTITAQEIERLRVRAVPLLFGCNSGKLERLGRTFDPTGTAQSYLVASAPSLLGFLWSITDMDLDTWTVDFLRIWLGEGREFVQTAAELRMKFKQLMNGAALVVYGLPSLKDRK